MSISLYRIPTSKILVVREISIYGADSSNAALAHSGLAIGNNIDNRPAFEDEELLSPFGSTRMHSYQMPYGKWPVYIVSNLQEVEERFLKKGGKDGAVVYVAEIDLNKVRIGTNVPFTTSKGLSSTTLKLVEEDGMFSLVANDELADMETELKLGFDESGRLKESRGEYFLDNYVNFQQLEEEFIYRLVDGEFVNITKDIQDLRAQNEAIRELRRGERKV